MINFSNPEGGYIPGDTLAWMSTGSPSALLLDQIQADCPEIEARPEQEECLEALRLSREAGDTTGLIQMATGLGKTTVIAADVRRVLEEDPDARVLFLCHQNRILDQAEERFRRILGPRYSYGKFTGEGEKDYHEVTCLFASFQAMSKQSWYIAFMPDEFQYVVVDESHHSKAQTYEKVIDHFEPDYLLGATATPDRHDQKDIREIYGQEKYQKPLEDAIAEGLLTPADYYVLVDKLETRRVLEDLHGQRFNRGQLNRTVFAPMRDAEMARICREKSEELGQPTRRLVFCESIEHTEQFALFFDKSATIHSQTPKSVVKARIEQLRNGEIETLLVVNVLNEGIDIPEVNQLVFARLTQSQTIFLQQLGRGLRKLPNKDRVQVLDFVANADRLALLQQFWQRVAQNPRRLDEDKETFSVNFGETRFDETNRDILEILEEINTSRWMNRALSKEDAIAYYQGFCERLGRIAVTPDIIRANRSGEGPSYFTLTKNFNKSLRELQSASGIDPADYEAAFRERHGGKVLTREEVIDYYRNMCTQLGRIATVEDIEAAARDGAGPSYKLLTTTHFDRSLRQLRAAADIHLVPTWSAEDSARVYLDVGGGKAISKSRLQQELMKRKDLPTIARLLEPFDGDIKILQARAGVTPTERKIRPRDKEPLTAEDSLILYQQLAGNTRISHRELGKRLNVAGDTYPGVKTLLTPFEGRLSNLQAALAEKLGNPLEAPPHQQRKNAQPRPDWTREDSIAVYKELSGETPLSVNELERHLREDRPDLPSIRIIMKPFTNMNALVKAAGYTPIRKSKHHDPESWTPEQSIAIYRELSGDKPLSIRDFLDRLQDQRNLPAISVILRPFNNRFALLKRAAFSDDDTDN